MGDDECRSSARWCMFSPHFLASKGPPCLCPPFDFEAEWKIIVALMSI